MAVQAEERREPAPAAAPKRNLRLLSGLGQTLLTLGVVVLLFCVYELWGTGLVTARAQDRLGKELTTSWQRPRPVAPEPVPGAAPLPAPAPELGTGVALLYLPTLRGADPLVVVEGVAVEDLKKGPGHLPDSADPGAVGNLVIAGHRTTYGAPFGDLDRLHSGDPVVVQTRDHWVTYRATGRQVVRPSDMGVTWPVPGEAAATPAASLLTLITCNPKFSAQQRLVLRGELTDSTPISAGRPAVLGG